MSRIEQELSGARPFRLFAVRLTRRDGQLKRIARRTAARAHDRISRLAGWTAVAGTFVWQPCCPAQRQLVSMRRRMGGRTQVAPLAPASRRSSRAARRSGFTTTRLRAAGSADRTAARRAPDHLLLDAVEYCQQGWHVLNLRHFRRSSLLRSGASASSQAPCAVRAGSSSETLSYWGSPISVQSKRLQRAPAAGWFVYVAAVARHHRRRILAPRFDSPAGRTC